MAQTALTAERISRFEKFIETQKNELDGIEKEMNNILYEFTWQDPIAESFRASYKRNFEPLRGKLFPALANYQTFLKELYAKTIEWEKDKISI